MQDISKEVQDKLLNRIAKKVGEAIWECELDKYFINKCSICGTIKVTIDNPLEGVHYCRGGEGIAGTWQVIGHASPTDLSKYCRFKLRDLLTSTILNFEVKRKE